MGATVAATAIEGAGGGIIAFAKELPAAQLGGMIMLAGLAFQLFIIVCYVALFVEVAWRYSRDREAPSLRIRRTRPDDYLPKGSLSEYDVGKVKILMIANGVSVGLVFIRTCYRIVGLAGGPKGKLECQNECCMLTCSLNPAVVASCRSIGRQRVAIWHVRRWTGSTRSLHLQFCTSSLVPTLASTAVRSGSWKRISG